MFVLTVDQVDSRHGADRVAAIIERTPELRAAGVLVGPDRTAGDEFQALTAAASTALDLVLDLHRRRDWRIGLGIGSVAEPLPPTTREGRGPAFVAARAAIEAARRGPFGVAVATEGAPSAGADATALLDLLLDVRARRSPGGWAVADLLATGETQRDAAVRLGITPQAVSLRVRAAGLRLEAAARPALVRMLAAIDVGGAP